MPKKSKESDTKKRNKKEYKMLDMLNEAFEYETDIIFLDEGEDAVEM